MILKCICRHGIWAVCCLLMVIFIVPGIAVCSAEKIKGTTAGDADVTTWLAELDSSPGVVAPSSYEQKSAVRHVDKAGKSGASYKQKNSVGKISIDFYKVDLHNVFRLLGQVGKKNIVVDEGVGGTLTLALQDVPWTFVLQVIKNLKGLASHEVNNTIMIYPSSKKVTWESDGISDAVLDFATAGDGAGGSSGLSIERMGTAGLDTGLEIEGGKNVSKVPPEQISAAVKLIKQAEAYEKRGNWDEAEQLLKKAGDIWFDNPVLLKKTANVALKNDDELNGYNYGRKALEADESDSEAAAITAVALARMSRAGEARTYFERAMAGRNVSLDTLWNYAVFSFSHNDFRNALRLITRIEMSYSLTPDLMMLKARTYENLSRKDKAMQEYRTIITAGKDIPPDMVRFARIRLQALTSDVSQTDMGLDNQAR